MKVAALDLGTNTFLCLIADVENGKIKKIFSDQVHVVRLGQGVNQTKKFHPEALVRADKALTDFSKTIAEFKPEKVLAMATSAARDVVNADDLFTICRRLKIPVEIIPGDREAEITFKGSVSGSNNSQTSRVVVDVGGGSTEVVKGMDAQIEFGESIDIGCVRLTEMFVPSYPVQSENLKNLRTFIRQQIAPVVNKINESGKIDEILAVAGTPTELARIEIGEFDPKKIDGYSFSIIRLREWADKFSRSKIHDIISKCGVTEGRADVILVGVIILAELCEALGQDKIKVSTRGVRFGVALELENR